MSEEQAEYRARGEPPFKEHLKSPRTWQRLVFIVLYLLCYAISRVVMMGVVAVQFLHVLFTGRTNEPLLALGQSLAAYTYELVRYLTFNTDVRPFPFDSPWPPSTPL